MLLRDARPDDVPVLLALVKELAEYERAAHEVLATEGDVAASFFGPESVAHGVLVEIDGDVVAMAVWFLNYSTWLGRPGLYLEDLYVRPSCRGRGVGRALMRHLAALCVERDYQRFEWSVLDWNAPSIAFYEELGAEARREWEGYRLSGEALSALGGEANAPSRP